MKSTRVATSRFLRIGMVAAVAVVLGGLLSGLLFLVALFLHNALIGRAAIVALASSSLGIGVTRGIQAYRLADGGRWAALDGQLTSRSEHPKRFATWLTLLSLFAAIHSAVAAFLIWVAIFYVH
jgi:hypothetical protein